MLVSGVSRRDGGFGRGLRVQLASGSGHISAAGALVLSRESGVAALRP